MKKFFVMTVVFVGIFLLVGFSTKAFADTYSGEKAQIIKEIHKKIEMGGESVHWKYDKYSISYSLASNCYKTFDGMIYSLAQDLKNTTEIYAIAEINLSAGQLRFLEIYTNNMVYDNLQKVEKFNKDWMSTGLVPLYCKYLREHYDEIPTVGNSGQTQARNSQKEKSNTDEEVWIASQDGDTDFYILTKTFKKISQEHFTVYLKMTYPEGSFSRKPVYTGNLTESIHSFDFLRTNGAWLYKSDQMGKYTSVENFELAKKIWEYCYKNLL